MLVQLWPYINDMVIKILKETVEPEIQKNMPSFLSSIHFEEISLGEVVGQLLQVELLTGEVTVETKSYQQLTTRLFIYRRLTLKLFL